MYVLELFFYWFWPIFKVGYGKTVLFNSVVTKARQRIAGYFGLQSGPVPDIQAKVEWLLTASCFIYGDLDVKVGCMLSFYICTLICSRQKPIMIPSHTGTQLSRTSFKQSGSTQLRMDRRWKEWPPKKWSRRRKSPWRLYFLWLQQWVVFFFVILNF